MTQQVGATGEQRLARQLERLKGIEKSEIRMIEADRRRFRMKYQKRDFPRASSAASPAVKEPQITDRTIGGLDDDHRPTNDASQRRPANKSEAADYQAVRSLIFTDGKIDLDKLLCLHLLSVHAIDIDEAELLPQISRKNGQSLAVAEESENSPSDILPCYVVEIQRDESSSRPEARIRCRGLDAAAEGAFQPPRAMPAPSAAGKMPMVSALLYNNLLESQAQRRGNPRGSPSLEHLLKYVHTGQMLDKSDEKVADKLPRAQSSTARRQSSCKRICKKEKYFICTETSSAASRLPAGQCRRVLICFNAQLKNFVRTVVDILRNINLGKAKALVDMLKNSQVVAAKLLDMEDFIGSLRDFSFVSLPESFTWVAGYAIEDAHSDGHETSKRPVAETLILEADASAFNSLLDDTRQSIGDFLKKPSAISSGVEHRLDNVSMSSVPSQSTTVNQTSSRMSFSVRKSVENFEPINESTTKSYEAIQQEFNEAASSRLSKNVTNSNLYTDPDRVILRRMTNSQRILVGQMCAALKTKRINNEGTVKDKIPLPALLGPVLSRESINYLTQGTIYAKGSSVDQSKVESKAQISSVCVNLTDFILTKIRHEMMEIESRSQLQNFMNNVV